MNKVTKFLVLMLWPFAIVVAVYLFWSGKADEKERRDRQELLSDTAKVNAAHRTYERIHKQQLKEDTYYQELSEENESLKQVIREKDY